MSITCCDTLATYEETPILITVDITEVSVEYVARKRLGSSGLGGTGSEALQGWLLKCGDDSTRLRTIFGNLVDWLANGSSLWATYCAFMTSRLIALDKQPGVRPVDVGETWRFIFANILLKVTGPEETTKCQDDQLCARLKAGIVGAIHGVQALWDENLSTEECIFLHVNTKNAFNEHTKVGMLRTMRHLWTSGAHFVFNCYRHWSSLVLWNGNGTASILHSKEGIAYGMGILPLIKNIKRAIPDVTQPWYADNAGALGTFARIITYFDFLTRQNPGRGYHPEPTKSVLIVRLDNLEAGKVFGERLGFRVCTGACDLGSYIGEYESKRDWLRQRTLTWENNINKISKTASKYPQESYATVLRAIQSEWIFLQRGTWDTGDLFAGVEKMIRRTFLPRLFFGKTKNLSPVVGALSWMPV